MDAFFRTEKDKFFVNFKKYGEKTISYDVQCEKGKLKGEMDAIGSVKAEVDGTVSFFNCSSVIHISIHFPVN